MTAKNNGKEEVRQAAAVAQFEAEQAAAQAEPSGEGEIVEVVEEIPTAMEVALAKAKAEAPAKAAEANEEAPVAKKKVKKGAGTKPAAPAATAPKKSKEDLMNRTPEQVGEWRYRRILEKAKDGYTVYGTKWDYVNAAVKRCERTDQDLEFAEAAMAELEEDPQAKERKAAKQALHQAKFFRGLAEQAAGLARTDRRPWVCPCGKAQWRPQYMFCKEHAPFFRLLEELGQAGLLLDRIVLSGDLYQGLYKTLVKQGDEVAAAAFIVNALVPSVAGIGEEAVASYMLAAHQDHYGNEAWATLTSYREAVQNRNLEERDSHFQETVVSSFHTTIEALEDAQKALEETLITEAAEEEHAEASAHLLEAEDTIDEVLGRIPEQVLEYIRLRTDRVLGQCSKCAGKNNGRPAAIWIPGADLCMACARKMGNQIYGTLGQAFGANPRAIADGWRNSRGPNAKKSDSQIVASFLAELNSAVEGGKETELQTLIDKATQWVRVRSRRQTTRDRRDRRGERTAMRR